MQQGNLALRPLRRRYGASWNLPPFGVWWSSELVWNDPGASGRFTCPGRGVHPTLAGDATPRRCGSDVARWVHVGGPEPGWGPCSCLTYLSTYYVAT